MEIKYDKQIMSKKIIQKIAAIVCMINEQTS